MSDLAYRLGVLLLWVSGAALVVVLVSLAVIAWTSRDKGGPWLGDG